jgi:hypothetical protein
MFAQQGRAPLPFGTPAFGLNVSIINDRDPLGYSMQGLLFQSPNAGRGTDREAGGFR